MLNNLRKHPMLPTVPRWDNMFDSMMSKLDLFPGEELHPDIDDHMRPDIEICDTAVTVRIAVPGFSKKDLSVEIENDILSVKGEHDANTPCCCKDKKVLRSERIHSEFNQSVRLPGDIKSSEAAAVCSDGVLTVSIPRENNNVSLARKIEVK